MTVGELFRGAAAHVREIFGPAWNDAEHVVVNIETAVASDLNALVHTAEKEIEMFDLPTIFNAIDRAKAKFASEAALQQQVDDLTAAGKAKDQQISDLTAANETLTQNLSDVQAQLLALSPDPNAAQSDQSQPPADGSGSADVQP